VLALVVCGIGFAVWELYLDPAGKVCWQWAHQGELYDMSILVADARRLVVRAEDRLVALAADTGRELQSLTLDAPGVERARVQTLADGVLVLGPENLTRLKLDGATVFSTGLGGEVAAFELSPDRLSAYAFVLPPTGPEPARAEAEKRERRLVCIDLATGTEAWCRSEGFSDKIHTMALCVGTDTVFLLLSKQSGPFEYQYMLWALDVRNRDHSWSVRLPESPDWGPVVSRGVCMFDVEGVIHAFSAAGEELWQYPAPARFDEHVAQDGLLFVGSATGTDCVDVDSGRKLWDTTTLLQAATLVVAGDRLYVRGFAAAVGGGSGQGKPSVKLPAAYEQNKDVLKDLGIDPAATGKQAVQRHPVLLCLERRTGREIWRSRNVAGWFCADAERLVVLMDTAETSMLEAVSGGKGVTVLRQYDPGTGRLLYSRQSELGVRDPVLAGAHLIGIEYRRVERPSLLNGISLGGSDEMPTLQGLGIVAFRLK